MRALLSKTGRRFGQLLADLLFPNQCVGCRRAGELLCATCLTTIGRFSEPRCSRCDLPTGDGRRRTEDGGWRMEDAGSLSSYQEWVWQTDDPRRPRWAVPTCDACHRSSSWLDGLRVVGPHEGPLRAAIHALKYRGRTSLAAPLGNLLGERWLAAPGCVV
ncbi:MAG: double zinc ribbon domain-containing protein, partial [Ardenticatenaceae bacterium]